MPALGIAPSGAGCRPRARRQAAGDQLVDRTGEDLAAPGSEQSLANLGVAHLRSRVPVGRERCQSMLEISFADARVDRGVGGELAQAMRDEIGLRSRGVARRSRARATRAEARVRVRAARHRPQAGRGAGAVRVRGLPRGPGLQRQSGGGVLGREAARLEDPDLGVVADQEPVGARLALVAPDLDVATEQRGLHPAVEVADARSRLSRIECSTSAFSITQPSPIAVYGPDVAVGQLRAGADDRRPADRRALEPARRARSRPGRRPASRSARPRPGAAIVSSTSRLAASMSSSLPGVLPPAVDDVRLDPQALVDEVLDRVGDLELAARRRLDRPGGVVHGRREHVDADERQVRLRLGGLLDQPHDRAVAQLGDPVLLGVGDRRQQDQRVGRPGAGTRRPGPRSRPAAGCRRGT